MTSTQNCGDVPMTGSDLNWPKKRDRAFKPSISAADQARLGAFVTAWQGLYLVGFQRAPDMIVAAAARKKMYKGRIA